MPQKPKTNKFSFAGYDASGQPIIHDADGNLLTVEGSQPIAESELPAGSQQVATLVVYHQNPTWVCIAGRCYRIG